MNYYLITFVFTQLLIEINCFVPNINSCFVPKIKSSFDNKLVLTNSLTLLRASIYNKNKWEPPEGYIPRKNKKVKWEPPEGYVPNRFKNNIITDIIDKEIEICNNKDDLYCKEHEDENENIEIEIDKILIKIEKIKNNVKNIKKYNSKNDY